MSYMLYTRNTIGNLLIKNIYISIHINRCIFYETNKSNRKKSRSVILKKLLNV